MDKIFRTVCAASLLALSGCANAPVLVPDYDYGAGFSEGEWGYSAADFPVLVHGNPFAVPQAEFNQAVADDMRGWTLGPEVNFDASGNPNAVYRVTMVFEPPGHATGYSLCARPAAAEPVFGMPPGPQAPVLAALCRGDQPLSSVTGSLATEGGPRGEAFSRGIGQVTRSLFHPRSIDNPHERDHQCPSC